MDDIQKYSIDLETVRTMYEEFGYAVHRRCMQLLRDRTAADDILQEVFLRVVKYRHTYRGGSRLAWLKRIAERLCLDKIRKEKPSLDNVSIDDGCETIISEQSTNISGEDRSWLIQIMTNAPLRIQKVVVLHYLEEMTLEEVSAAIGCSSSTVKRRLRKMHHIAKKLKKDYSKQGK